MFAKRKDFDTSETKYIHILRPSLIFYINSWEKLISYVRECSGIVLQFLRERLLSMFKLWK